MQPCMYCRSYRFAIGCGLTYGVLKLGYPVVCPSLPSSLPLVLLMGFSSVFIHPLSMFVTVEFLSIKCNYSTLEWRKL